MINAAEHVVFGTGAVGSAVVEALRRRGARVRAVSRSGRAALGEGVEVVAGDAGDPAFAREVAAGARIVYQAAVPPYHRWAQELPRLQQGVLAAAEATGARLVAMDNVYQYGPPEGRLLTEDLPAAPTTRKGRLRAQMAEDLLAAHRAGRVPVTIGRASDYFGPRGGAQSMIGDRVVPRALAGKPAQVIGDPDQQHTYTFLPDIGEGLVVLGERDEALGRAWHLPSPETRTTRQVLDLVYAQAGHPTRVRTMPRPLMRAVGLVNPTVRELVEMLYEFEAPFVVDSTRFEKAFGISATPLEEAVAATVADYRR